MQHIALYNRNGARFTRVSNDFIEYFMTEANEAQIKIYLYLLRCSNGDLSIDVDSIAERFNYTERDILRALMYWDKKGLLSLDFDSKENVRGICLNDVDFHTSLTPLERREKPKAQPIIMPEANSTPKTWASQKMDTEPEARPFYSQEQLSDFRDREEVKELFFTAEQYLGRTISNADIVSIMYMYEELHFPAELIQFLIEYCVNAGHRNIRYIETTALKWNDKGIKDLDTARKEVCTGGKDCYAVLKAFGLSGRKPVQYEIDLIRHWRNDYGFEMDIIIEAVNRTMKAIAKPNFNYADSILKKWKELNVRKPSDIDLLDADFREKKNSVLTKKSLPPIPPNDKFRNFEERDYNYDDLLKRFAKN